MNTVYAGFIGEEEDETVILEPLTVPSVPEPEQAPLPPAQEPVPA